MLLFNSKIIKRGKFHVQIPVEIHLLKNFKRKFKD